MKSIPPLMLRTPFTAALAARLVCAVAQEIAGGKTLSADELEARRKLVTEADKRQREDEMKKDLAFMDRMIDLFREFMKAAMERETASAALK